VHTVARLRKLAAKESVQPLILVKVQEPSSYVAAASYCGALLSVQPGVMHPSAATTAPGT